MSNVSVCEYWTSTAVHHAVRVCLPTRSWKTAALSALAKRLGVELHTSPEPLSLPAALELHSGRNLRLPSPAVTPRPTEETAAISLAISQFCRHAERLLLWVTAMDSIACIALPHNHHAVKNLTPVWVSLKWKRTFNCMRHVFSCCRVLTLVPKIEAWWFRHLGFFSPSIVAASFFFSFYKQNTWMSFRNNYRAVHQTHQSSAPPPLAAVMRHILRSVSFTSHLMCLIVEKIYNRTHHEMSCTPQRTHKPNPHTHTHTHTRC